jgi:nucleoid DNA-binding protein
MKHNDIRFRSVSIKTLRSIMDKIPIDYSKKKLNRKLIHELVRLIMVVYFESVTEELMKTGRTTVPVLGTFKVLDKKIGRKFNPLRGAITEATITKRIKYKVSEKLQKRIKELL